MSEVGEVALTVLAELDTLEQDGHLYGVRQLTGQLDQLYQWAIQHHNTSDVRKLGSVVQALRWLDDGTIADTVRRIHTAATR